MGPMNYKRFISEMCNFYLLLIKKKYSMFLFIINGSKYQDLSSQLNTRFMTKDSLAASPILLTYGG